jgi:predicted small integral membrane protein
MYVTNFIPIGGGWLLMGQPAQRDGIEAAFRFSFSPFPTLSFVAVRRPG